MTGDGSPSRRVLARRLVLAAAVASALAGLLPMTASGNAAPGEVAREWGSPRLQGAGRLRFLGLSVYDVRLWTPDAALGDENWVGQPLALEIEYSRALDGQQIAQRSLDEMRRGGEIAPATAERWLARMVELFPDVRAGDRLTGVQRPGGSVRFFLNGKLRGEIADAEFARRFFGIWLAPYTSEPKLRASLLGKP